MRIADYPSTSAMTSFPQRPAPENAAFPQFHAEHLQEGRLLLQLGIPKPVIARMMLRAHESGASVETELLVSGEIREDLYYEAVARSLRLPFLPHIDAARLHDTATLDVQLRRPEMLRLFHPDRSALTVIVPALANLQKIADTLVRHPKLAHVMAVSTQTAVRRAVWECGRQRRVRQTGHHLFETALEHSARIVFRGKQGFYAGLCLALFVISAIAWPLPWLIVLHLLLSLLFLSQLCLRGQALLHARSASSSQPLSGRNEAPLPVYSVFVALYRERDVVAQLVGALDRLDWPPSRLDIKLICEEDDRETVDTLMALQLGPQYEIVLVPPTLPRTKPKALSYALPGARGALLTIFDAEDRPDPGQLREAYAAFLSAGPKVACLQAPLVITNAGQGWLSTMFALEYAGLFRGLLPFLASADLPLPLGGTSNHFRVEALQAVGGWDPYNTTEDADLGLRFHRLGYRSNVIWRPTWEDAPTQWRNWFGQRTRWYKGWLQTWLVLMRDPPLLLRQMGWQGFLVFQVLIGGMILSALSHPLSLAFVATTGWMLATGGMTAIGSVLPAALLAIDSLNIIGSYLVLVQLGRKVMPPDERRALGWKWITVPAYCILISGAAWAAIIELYRNPFSWNKTEHRPVASSSATKR